MTEFKSASSDMRNATRTFMETKDLVSRVKHAMRLLPCGQPGCFRSFSADNAERMTIRQDAAKGVTSAHGTRIQPGQVFARGLAKWDIPSRFPTSIASQIAE